MEIWKSIKGFENEYEISNLGNLRSKNRFVKHYIKDANRFYKAKSKKIRLGKDGYYKCTLKKDSLRFDFRVHRLVADTFLENNDSKKIVNHKNGIKTDNRIENLEWCTSSENVIHAVEIGLIKSKLNDKEVIDIYLSKLSNRKLAKEYNVDSTIIWRIKNKKAYKHIWQQHFLLQEMN